jgi:hypothetical protein
MAMRAESIVYVQIQAPRPLTRHISGVRVPGTAGSTTRSAHRPRACIWELGRGKLMICGAVGFERAFVPATGLDLIEDITVGDALRQAGLDASDLTALKEGAGPGQAARRWTYAELLADAQRVARAMLESVDPGERVAICATHGVPPIIGTVVTTRHGDKATGFRLPIND